MFNQIARQLTEAGINLSQEMNAFLQFLPGQVTVLAVGFHKTFQIDVPEFVEPDERFYMFMEFGNTENDYDVVLSKDGRSVIVRHHRTAH